MKMQSPFVRLLILLVPFAAWSQVTVIQSPTPQFRSFLPSGAPNVSGCVYTFTTGTSTPQATYTDFTGTTPNTNPVILDGTGSANIWISSAVYRIQVWSFGSGTVGSNCGGGTQLYQVDGVKDTGLNAFGTGPVTIAAISNGIDIFDIIRATDVSPTGNFVNFKSFAGSSLFKVDVLGNVTGQAFTGTNATFSGSVTTGTLNNTCIADQQAGADYGAKINTCLAHGSSTDVLLTGGGTVTTQILINAISDVRIMGIGHQQVGLTDGITGSGSACMIKIVGNVSGVTLENFQILGNGLTGASGNGNGICIVGTGPTPSLISVKKVIMNGLKGTGVDGLGASMPSAGLYAFKMIDLFIDWSGSNSNQRGYVLDTLVNNAQISNSQAFQNVLAAVQTKGGAGGGNGKIIIGPYNDFEGNGTLISDIWLSPDSCQMCTIWGNWFESNSGEILLSSNTVQSSFDFYDNIIIHGANGSVPQTSQALDSAANVDFDIHNNYFNMQQSMTNIIDINPSTSAGIGKRIRNNSFDFTTGTLGNLGFSWQGGTHAGPCILEGNTFGTPTNPAFSGAASAVDVGGNVNGCRVTNNACTTSTGTLTNCVKVESGSTNTFVSGTVTSGAGTITNIVNDAGNNTICSGAGCPGAGAGIPVIRGVTSQKAETGTADANVLTVTPPAAIGTYRACLAVSVSTATAGIIQFTLAYKGANATSVSINPPLFQNNTAAPALTFTTSAAGDYQGCWQFQIDNSATNIVVGWAGGGTTAAKVTATVERLI